MGSLLDNSLQVISKTTGKSLFVRIWPLTSSPKGYYTHLFLFYHTAYVLITSNTSFSDLIVKKGKFLVKNFQVISLQTAHVQSCLQPLRNSLHSTRVGWTLSVIRHDSSSVFGGWLHSCNSRPIRTRT